MMILVVIIIVQAHIPSPFAGGHAECLRPMGRASYMHSIGGESTLYSHRVFLPSPFSSLTHNAHLLSLLSQYTQLDKNQAIQVKKEATDGYDAVQVGAGEKKLKRVNQPERGHYDRWINGNSATIPAKRKLWEFRATPDALVAPGEGLRAFLLCLYLLLTKCVPHGYFFSFF